MFDAATYVGISIFESWSHPDNTSADFIVERALVGITLPPLANFYYETMNAYLTPYQIPLGSYATTSITMTQDGTSRTAPVADPRPSSLSNGQPSFTDYYDRCQ